MSLGMTGRFNSWFMLTCYMWNSKIMSYFVALYILKDELSIYLPLVFTINLYHIACNIECNVDVFFWKKTNVQNIILILNCSIKKQECRINALSVVDVICGSNNGSPSAANLVREFS